MTMVRLIHDNGELSQNNGQVESGQWKGNVHCLPSVTGLSSKLVFNVADHYTLL